MTGTFCNYLVTLLLTSYRSYNIDLPSSLVRGVSGDDPAGGAGSGVARAGRRGYEKPVAVARHEQWLAASSLLAGPAERVRSGSWADNATVERREAASRLHGTVHASQAWCRASPARQLKAVRLPALRRPLIPGSEVMRSLR